MPMDDAGRPITPDYGRESVARSWPGERHPDRWQQIGEPLWRGLKQSVVSAGMCGAISPEHAQGLIDRFGLRDL